MGSKRILVVGSTRLKNWKKESRKEYSDACRQIGEVLARARQTVVLGSRADNDDTIDRFVLEGANSVPRRTRVVVYFRAGEEAPFHKEHSRFNNITFDETVDRGPFWGRVFQVQNAEAVVLIGGGDGTEQAGLCARALGRPILALPCFGGGAQKVWEGIQGDYERDLDKSSMSELQKPWEGAKADLVIRVLDQLIRIGAAKSRRLGIRLPAVLILLGAWTWLFTAPLAHRPVSFLLILVISAFIGTAARTSNVEGKSNSTISAVVNDAATGLLLAFGLMLLYFAGGITINGDASFLGNLDEDAGFRRTAIVFSVLGFAGAFTMEATRRRITSWLEKLTSDGGEK